MSSPVQREVASKRSSLKVILRDVLANLGDPTSTSSTSGIRPVSLTHSRYMQK